MCQIWANKMVSGNGMWKQKLFVLIVFDFFWFMIMQKVQKYHEKWEKYSFWKYFHQMYDICCKFSTNIAILFWYLDSWE